MTDPVATPFASPSESVDGPMLVSLGLDVPVCWPDQPAVPVIDDDEMANPSSAFAALQAILGEGTELVGVVSALDADDVLSGARSARALLPSGSMALLETELPPLAAGVLMALAAKLVPLLSGRGEIASALPMLERELLHITCLPSVAKLRSPAPSVAQHARSFLPASKFTVVSHPDAMVRSVQGHLFPGALPRSEGPVAAVAAGDGGGRDGLSASAMLDLIDDKLTLERRETVDEPRASRAWWGAHAAEAVIYPLDLTAVAKRVRRRVAGARCGWCEAAIAREVCELCGMVQVEREAAE